MGKNKGKGSMNLRRINSDRKRIQAFEKEYARLKAIGLPDVNFEWKPLLRVIRGHER